MAFTFTGTEVQDEITSLNVNEKLGIIDVGFKNLGFHKVWGVYELETYHLLKEMKVGQKVFVAIETKNNVDIMWVKEV